MKIPVTHDYTHPNRRWGHDLTYKLFEPNGHRLDASGWGSGINEGDYILLSNGNGITRYQFQKIEYLYDPKDMWKAVLVFSPRQPK